MTTIHTFQIGQIQCAVLEEYSGTVAAPDVPQSFINVEPAVVLAALGDVEQFETSMNILLVSTPSMRLLVDVGFGVQRRPQGGNLLAALASMGHTPADIDLIFLSHFHGDHIIGLFDEADQPIYPNANYVTTRAEWEQWTMRWAASSEPNDAATLKRMQSLGSRLALVADGALLTEGVQVVAAHGHTLGHAGLLLSSEGDQLLHVVDILHRPPQFAHPQWHFVFDTDPVMAAETRQRLLEHCADAGILTLFYHLPFPGLGHVIRAGAAFAWQPLEPQG